MGRLIDGQWRDEWYDTNSTGVVPLGPELDLERPPGREAIGGAS